MTCNERHKIKELLNKAVGLCFEISNTTKADVFFNYSPHINTVSVNYHIDGYAAGDDFEYLKDYDGCILFDCKEESLQRLVVYLREMKARLKNGIL